MSTTLLQRNQQDSAVQEILKHGFVEIGANKQFLWPAISHIREGMRRLTENALFWHHFPWRMSAPDAYGKNYIQEVGLRLPKSNSNGEYKFVFHYMPDMLHELWRQQAPVLEFEKFFTALREVHEWTYHIALVMAEQFDAANRHAHWYGGSLRQGLRNGRAIIRVLRYCPKANGLPDAAVHVDRSLFTVHLWSSHQGLRIFSPDGNPHSVFEKSADIVAVFPGEKFAAVTRGSLGYGSLHGVRDERPVDERDDSRYAIVAFVHPETNLDDARWILTHKKEIEAYEHKFSL